MGTELLTIIATVAGVFIVFIIFRLTYIDKQFDDLLPKYKTKQDDADTQLQAEIAKRKPNKESVLNFANQIASYTTIRKTIKSLSKENRAQIVLDIIAVGSIISIGIVDIDKNPLGPYAVLILPIAIIAGFFSGVSFFEKLYRMSGFKNKAMDLED